VPLVGVYERLNPPPPLPLPLKLGANLSEGLRDLVCVHLRIAFGGTRKLCDLGISCYSR
jgi:hypothetical protein